MPSERMRTKLMPFPLIPSKDHTRSELKLRRYLLPATGTFSLAILFFPV